MHDFPGCAHCAFFLFFFLIFVGIFQIVFVRYLTLGMMFAWISWVCSLGLPPRRVLHPSIHMSPIKHHDGETQYLHLTVIHTCPEFSILDVSYHCLRKLVLQYTLLYQSVLLYPLQKCQVYQRLLDS